MGVSARGGASSSRGGIVRSSASASRLELRWTFAEKDETGQAKGIHELLGIETFAAGKPILLHVRSQNADHAKESERITTQVFEDERIQIASRLFENVYVNWTSVDERLARHLGDRDVPAVVVFDGEGKRLGLLNERPTPSALYSILKRAVSKEYKTPLSLTIKRVRSLLNAIDNLEAMRDYMRSHKCSNPARHAKKLVELEHEAAELAVRERKLLKTVMARK